jgi:hypothetical protein
MNKVFVELEEYSDHYWPDCKIILDYDIWHSLQKKILEKMNHLSLIVMTHMERMFLFFIIMCQQLLEKMSAKTISEEEFQVLINLMPEIYWENGDGVGSYGFYPIMILFDVGR